MDELDFDSLNTDCAFDASGLDALLSELSQEHEISLVPQNQANPLSFQQKRPTAGDETGVGHRASVTTRAAKRYCYDLSASKKALEHVLKLPEPDETLHCLMGGDYRAFDVLLAVAERAGEPMRSLTVTTLGFNRHNIAHLCQMIRSGAVADVQLLCSEYMQNVDSDLYGFARGELERAGAILRAARNHSKILCMDFGSRAFVVESSANLRSCNNLEQFTLTHSRELYDFHRTWIRSVIASQT